MILFLPFAVAGACFSFHLLLRACFGPIGQKGVMGLGLLVSFLFLFFGRDAGERLFFLLAAGGFSSVYFHAFNMALTARRVEILVRALEKEEGKPSPPYAGPEALSRRLSRLVALGVIREAPGGQLELKPGLLLLGALAFGGLRRLFYPAKP